MYLKNSGTSLLSVMMGLFVASMMGVATLNVVKLMTRVQGNNRVTYDFNRWLDSIIPMLSNSDSCTYALTKGGTVKPILNTNQNSLSTITLYTANSTLAQVSQNYGSFTVSKVALKTLGSSQILNSNNVYLTQLLVEATKQRSGVNSKGLGTATLSINQSNPVYLNVMLNASQQIIGCNGLKLNSSASSTIGILPACGSGQFAFANSDQATCSTSTCFAGQAVLGTQADGSVICSGSTNYPALKCPLYYMSYYDSSSNSFKCGRVICDTGKTASTRDQNGFIQTCVDTYSNVTSSTAGQIWP